MHLWELGCNLSRVWTEGSYCLSPCGTMNSFCVKVPENLWQVTVFPSRFPITNWFFLKTPDSQELFLLKTLDSQMFFPKNFLLLSSFECSPGTGCIYRPTLATLLVWCTTAQCIQVPVQTALTAPSWLSHWSKNPFFFSKKKLMKRDKSRKNSWVTGF